MLYYSLFSVPPVIEGGTQQVTAVTGARTFLRCEAQGLPSPDVVWTKDGLPLSTSPPSLGPLRFRQHPVGSLDFSYVETSDAGKYKCIASNAAGSASRKIELIIHGKFYYSW